MTNRLGTSDIYEIFRACRLCGAGGGYKMPIIQSVPGFEHPDLELPQKIRECVQIEVAENDKMPPLICELCIEKVNDYYEFLEMCRQTNKRTRMRLGLPSHTIPQGSSEGGDCILGHTEPIYVPDDDDDSDPSVVFNNDPDDSDEPQSTTRPKPRLDKGVNFKKKNNAVEKKAEDTKVTKKTVSKKELDHLDIQEDTIIPVKGPRSTSMSSRYAKRPSPPRARATRSSAASEADNKPLSQQRAQDQQKTTENPKVSSQKSILKKDKEVKREKEDVEEDDCSLMLSSMRTKRLRDGDKAKLEVPTKKVKIVLSALPKTSLKPSPKSKRPASPLAFDNSKPSPKSKRPASPPRLSFERSKPSPKSKRPLSPLASERSKPSPNSKRPESPLAFERSKPSPKSKRPASPLAFECSICSDKFKTVQGMLSHKRLSHVAAFTNPKLACNACGEWFLTSEETAEHHKRHRVKNKPYRCRRCSTNFRLEKTYAEHFGKKQCVPEMVVLDVKCAACSQGFPTKTLLAAHRCSAANRPGGKCSKCTRTFALFKNLHKHESVCTFKKKKGLDIYRRFRGQVKPAQVRMARCDPLLRNKRRGRYDVSTVPANFGLDDNCVYPFMSWYGRVKIKTEPLRSDGMVSIKQEIKDEFYVEEDYVHWDSDLSSESDEEDSVLAVPNPVPKKKRVDSLTTLSLKTLFSKRCLGKVPRKLRKMKTDKFDSFFNTNEFDNEISSNIDNIIDNLGNDDANDSANVAVSDLNSSVNYDSDSLLEDQDKSILKRVEKKDVDSSLSTGANEGDVNSDSLKANNNVSSKNYANDGYDTDASIENKENDEYKHMESEISAVDTNKTNDGSESRNGKDEETDINSLVEDDDSQKTESLEDFNVQNGVITTESNDKDTKEKSDLDIGTKNNGQVDAINEKCYDGSTTADIIDISLVAKDTVDDLVEKSEKAVNGKSEKQKTDDLEDVSDTEINDRKLMEDLDEQIGENNHKDVKDKTGKVVNKSDDKITLDDLVTNDFDRNSVGLDNVSDEEFNFDA